LAGPDQKGSAYLLIAGVASCQEGWHSAPYETEDISRHDCSLERANEGR